MFDWVSSKVATSVVVLIVALSFLGLFGMQIDHYRSLELRDVANKVTDLVTDVDLMGCQVRLEINWTDCDESFGLPRDFQGAPYLIEFTRERPYIVHDGHRVAGRYFPNSLELCDGEGEPTELLEVSSTTGFVISSRPQWSAYGLHHPIQVTSIG
jgi:hypothetical protein